MTTRRNFLKRIALLGAAATLPVQHVQHLFAENITPSKPVGDGLSNVSYGQEMFRKKAPPRTITIPDAGEYKVLKGDFHIHTLFSDGAVMPKDRVVEAIDNGLDVISITDHIEFRPNFCSDRLKFAENNDDHNWGYNLAKPEAEKNNLILVRGTEITKQTMPPGHFNALFIKDANAIAAEVDDWKKMLAVAAEQGGFIHWNHPGWVSPDYGGLKPGEPMQFFDEIEEVRRRGHMHGVEVFNGVWYQPIALDWCNERDLAPIANTDIHSSDWNMYGHQNLRRPMTLIFAKERAHDSVREAFFAKRTVGWAADMIFGRPEWVEKLFRACVEVNKTASGLMLRNISDIPCVFDANGRTFELSAKGALELPSLPKLTVSNWFIAMKKPLEIAVA
jgi:predicted metal-dependent phosphoesterase TrpH